MYIVKYTGPLGFIKPWTAVKDIVTQSQSFLTPSIVEGMRQKFGVSKIVRHKLYFRKFTSPTDETTQSKDFYKEKGVIKKRSSIVKRCLLINPILFLAFDNLDDAEKAHKQHICLCRNEDMLLPTGDILILTENEFDNLKSDNEVDNELLKIGFELIFEKNDNSFMVGYNRYKNNEPMWGWLKISI